MTDLIERLRRYPTNLGNEAADEIERLRSALAQSIESVRELIADHEKETELMHALRARIDAAPSATLEFSITGGWWLNADKGARIPQAMNGKRVKLVLEVGKP